MMAHDRFGLYLRPTVSQSCYLLGSDLFGHDDSDVAARILGAAPTPG